MNPLGDFVIINPMLRDNKARSLNHGFGQRALFTLLTRVVNLWSKGWWGLGRSWMHIEMFFQRQFPKMFLTLLGTVLQLLCVLSDITELTQWMVCFILLATQFPDRGLRTMVNWLPWGSSPWCARSGWGQPFLDAKLTHRECGFPTHRFEERSSRAPMPKEGNRISCPPLGIESQLGCLAWCHGPCGVPEWGWRGFPLPPQLTCRAASGWAGFPKGCTIWCLFRAIRWDESTLFLKSPTPPRQLHFRVTQPSHPFTLTPLAWNN